jgi:hypothetical protein
VTATRTARHIQDQHTGRLAGSVRDPDPTGATRAAALTEPARERFGSLRQLGWVRMEPGDRVTRGDFAGYVVGDDDIAAFTAGNCGIWAAVAAHQHGWPVVAAGHACNGECDPDDRYGIRYDDNDDITDQGACMCECSHFLVQHPDGTLWDARGRHGWDDIAAAYDNDPQVVNDNVLNDVLDSWHSRNDAEIVGWADLSVREVIGAHQTR